MLYMEELIKKLQEVRGSKIVCYITADRHSLPDNLPGFSTQVSSDAYFYFYEHLKALQGESKKKIPILELFLYTRGGEIDAVLPLVNLFRNYSDKFNVIIPSRAHSAGTLIALGADKIVMSKIGELSPIDPTTANQFNPLINPNDPKSPPKGISVEDVASYFKLAFKKNETEDKSRILEIKDETAKLEIFKELTKQVNPLALGNVYRVYLQIRLLAKTLLRKHLKPTNSTIQTIIQALVEDYFSHRQSIDFEEAKKIFGNIIEKPTFDEEKIMLDLLEKYRTDMELDKIFSIREFMGDELLKDKKVIGAYIQSENKTHIFESSFKVTQKSDIPPNINIQAPPGNPIPLIPNLPRAFNIDVVSLNWKEK